MATSTTLGGIKLLLNSTPGQFLLGGATVSTIAYFSNNLHPPNTALAGLIAAMPIGMPSSVFVDNTQVAQYSWHLLIMSVVLLLSTFSNWYLISHMKLSKYSSVAISLALFWGIGLSYIYLTGGAKQSLFA